MYKYSYYLFVLFTVIIRRIVFPFIFLVIPFRAYLRNRIYNYHLENGIILKRLWEREPKRVLGGWILFNHGHGNIDGFVKKNKVNTLQYYFLLPFWLLLDDDANEDTYSKGFNLTIINKERKKWMPEFIVEKLKKAVEYADNSDIKGNTFDLGDNRSRCPLYEFWSVFWWTLRNPAYNFNYKFNQTLDPAKVFSFVIKGRIFGWMEHGYIVMDGKKIPAYSWEFGKVLKDK